MNASDFLSTLQGAFAPEFLNILGALGVLVIGWLLAVIVRAVVRRALGALSLDERLSESVGNPIAVEKPVGLAFFWLVILMTIVGVLSALNLTEVSAPIQAMVIQITSYLPQLLAALALMLVAWLAATVCRALATRLIAKTSLDDRLSHYADMQPMSANVGTVLFWLVILMFVPAVVGALGITGLLAPFASMINDFIGILPNVFAALVIAGAGWLLARILRGLTVNALAAMGLDRRAIQAGAPENSRLSQAAGTIVFVLVLIPAVIAALDALAIEAISRPASDMLGQLLAAVPGIVAALLILVIAYVVARLIADLVSRLTATAGVDSWPQKLGVKAEVPDAARPSKVLGSLVLFFAMLFAATEAANQLGLDRLGELLETFVRFAADVLLGAVVLVVGFVLAGYVHGAIRHSSGSHGELLAQVARFAIIGLVLAMGLRAMGIADDIVNLGFGLTLGSVAVAVALAFGLGGREAAAGLLQRWISGSGRTPPGS